jgi:hypothetical protein
VLAHEKSNEIHKNKNKIIFRGMMKGNINKKFPG